MAKLRLTGDTSGFTEVSSPAVAGNANIILPSGVGQANQFLRNTETSGTLGWSNVIETATGVGINTVSPDANLSVSGVASFAAGTSGTPSIAAFGDLNTGIYFPSADTVAFTAGGKESSRINNSGILLVGTTNANGTALVQVSGDVLVNSVNGGPLAGFRNAIINGGMQVAQRAAPTITGTPQYGKADRFLAYISGGTGISGTIDQSADAQFKSGYRLWLASLGYTNGTWAIQQRIESFNSVGLNGLTVTVSFKIYHDFGSSRAVGVSLSKANALDNFGSVTAVAAYTSPALTSGAYSNVSCSFAIGASDATNGLLLQINDSSSTTVSAKNILIGDVQLEIGSVATPFERRPIGMELALCQRYFHKGASLGSGKRMYNSTGVFNGMNVSVDFPVTMRTSPTIAVIVDITDAAPIAGGAAGTDITIHGFTAYTNINNGAFLDYHSHTASAEL